MQNILKKLFVGVILIMVLFVSACTAAGEGEPTPDLDAIRTEAVKTAMVEMTVQAALAPTKTSLPPTLTPLPTATLSSDAAQPAGGSSSSSGGSSSGGSSGAQVPTWTPDVYRCEYVTQVPLDGPQMTGWNYDMIWTLRNVGTAVWNTVNYYVKWTGGDDLSPKHIYKLPHDVGYYETVDILIDIAVPPSPVLFPGYTTNWAIINDNGEVMCQFYHHITLTYPPPTATPNP